MNKKLDIYFFGESGPYDEFNSKYVKREGRYLKSLQIRNRMMKEI